MSSRSTLALIFALVSLTACENADEPLEPAWGRQRCGNCSMVVGDKRFAAELITAKGERLFFDDPGCLASYELSHASPQHAWLLSEGQWLEPQAARFAAGAKSPMDYGFEARKDGNLAWADVQKKAYQLNLQGAR